MYIWLFSRSVGEGSAITRNTRGLTRSVIALIVAPFQYDADPETLVLHPFLELHQLDVELGQLLVVFLALDLPAFLVTGVAPLCRFLVLGHVPAPYDFNDGNPRRPSARIKARLRQFRMVAAIVAKIDGTLVLSAARYRTDRHYPSFAAACRTWRCSSGTG